MTSKKYLILFVLLLANFCAISSSYWEIIPDKNLDVPGTQRIFPKEFRIAKLSTSDFNLFQSFIPNEESGLMADFSLPTPDGEFMNFHVYECPMMEKPLADKYPMIKTYTAICIENPLITAKLDFTLFGFHAMIFNGENTWFIDPYTDVKTDWYMVYYKKNFSKPLNQRMHCEMEDHKQPSLSTTDEISLDKDLPALASKQNGLQKRNYRLALACTIEYADAVCTTTPTKPLVLSAMTTSINRINGVFEREFSMHLNFVAKEDTLIFISGTDPYTNNSGSTMLGQNQTTVNSRIGSANYDIGHVFSTGGGGIASLASVCGTVKAQGVTGSPSPVGDPFDIDYVAHEMGHQYGGEHTFNSVSGSCSGNRSTLGAFEIGSATTIMGYAGICSPDDIQQHSDDYYHFISLEQMTNSAVIACADSSASGNSLPTLPSINNTYIIPYRTDFELTAPAGVDANNDPLTYCWEEWEAKVTGSQSQALSAGCAWNATASASRIPMQRSFFPTTDRNRTFPALKQLLLNTESYLGERLPETARKFKYRCTLRDLHNGWGAFYTSLDSVILDVRTTTSLFRVTSQATSGSTFGAWNQINVTWDVAGTTAAPFNTANVDIYLSIDSGKNFNYPMALNTANDGSQMITMPNVTTTANYCRIKVKAAGNVYFDLNDAFFKITPAPAGVTEITKADLFNIYPNPVNDVLHIESKDGSMIQSIRLTDMSGRVVMEQLASSDKVQLNTSSLAKGVYILMISNGAQEFSSRITK